jgi:hypothetical protein
VITSYILEGRQAKREEKKQAVLFVLPAFRILG